MINELKIETVLYESRQIEMWVQCKAIFFLDNGEYFALIHNIKWKKKQTTTTTTTEHSLVVTVLFNLFILWFSI